MPNKYIPEDKIIFFAKKIRKTPIVLSGILLEMLRTWFARYSQLYKWDKDTLKSQIHIEMSEKWDRDQTQARPGVYIKRGIYLPRGLGKTGFEELYSVNLINSQRTFAIAPIVGYYIFVISKNLGEVEQLSWEVASLLMGLAPIVKKDLDIIEMEVKQISQATKHEEYKEFWIVTIELQFKFTETWTLEEAAPKLHSVAIQSYTNILNEIYKEESSEDKESSNV